MKKISSEISYDLYDSANELPETDRQLLNDAISAAGTAYAPYSNFHVGAAVLMENGQIVKGSNQENAAYPSGLCAERVAVFAAGAHYPGIKIKAIAITAMFNDLKDLLSVSPCGDCRQVMAEYEHRYHANIRLIMTAENGKIMVIPNVQTLLPLMFNGENLKK
ncbi:MAG TPA: cytidine deaminase [Bacteroidia bacterium]|nr:cytidine deaminase [Bacteroidia bacterium]